MRQVGLQIISHRSGDVNVPKSIKGKCKLQMQSARVSCHRDQTTICIGLIDDIWEEVVLG